ncbi:AsmA family protein [Rhodobacter sp. SGA-6-6]|uniref:AsmA family protein n=1 Tax=Rhodobacter sp. SGA-6-6 TaxID=2710882 RepID=UPI0013EBC027|nr:AsmA family protein [Rhodobacter sp. SGA-6-6]NGM45241.1 AsmA family protein [Rhodobacter sp. SGA-6-6]
MRWLLRAVGALLVLGLLALGLLALVPSDRIAQAAAQQFERLTGRALQIEGDVSPRFWPVLGVTTGPVTVANADWSDEGPMFRAESLTVEINASALLGGEIRILGLRAERPQILLERAKDGRENWVFGGGGAAGEVSTETPGVGRAYTLEEGLIRGGTLRFIDHGTGQDIALDDVGARLAIPDFSGPFTLSAEALVQGQPVSLAAEAGVFSAFTEGRIVPLSLTAGVGGATVSFEGRGGWQPLAAEGALKAELSDLSGLAALAGGTAPDLPQGLGAQSLSVAGLLTLDGSGAAYLRQATIRADGNTITGEMDLKPGKDRPKLTANLSAGALALPGISGGQGGGAGGGMEAAGWPTDRIDVSALGLIDAEVALVAGSVDLGLVKFGETRVIMALDRARAVFDIRKLAAYGGAVTGEFVVNGRGGLSVGGKLALAGLQMQPLLVDVSGWDRLIAQGNLTLNFLGVGNSVDEIMRGLKGDGSLSLGKGELKGLDIGGMLRTLDAGYVGEGQKTIFDGVAASFSIVGGVLTNSDLKLVAPYVTATGAGEVGLGTRTLNYRLRPTALAGEDGSGGVMVPLLITGPWSKPSFKLDLETIAREKMEAEARAAEERLKAEAAAAEAKAKAELEAKLKEELGVEAVEGESLEEAAKRRAQEALDAEARRLLEGILGGN